MDVSFSYLLEAVRIEAASLLTQNGVDLLGKDDAKPETQSQKPKPKPKPFVSYFLSNLATKATIDILANGSRPGSKQQEDLLLHSRKKPIDWINEIFPLTVEFLTETGNAGGPIIKYSLAAWVDQSVTFKERFNKVIRDFYKPDFHTRDFEDTETLKREVNEWVREKTGALIKDVVGSYAIGPYTRLILTAALDFKGEWFAPFQDAGVQKFTLLSGKKVDMEFMTSKKKHYVKQFTDYKVAVIPFKQDRASNFSMWVYLSDNIKDTEKLRNFIGQQEAVIQEVYAPEEQVEMGNFLIPKFKLTEQGPLPWNPPFEFDEIENSSRGLISRGGRLSSNIEVNERGIRAAGVTAFFVNEKPRLAPRSIIMPYPIEKEEFVANRPFIFFIRDNRFRRMLFSGALINPAGIKY